MKNVPVLQYANTVEHLVAANVSCDSSVDNQWNIYLNGTDTTGDKVDAKYMVADNTGNAGIAYVSIGSFRFSVSPYTRKNFTFPDYLGSVRIQVTVGILTLTISNSPAGIPDEVNQYATNTTVPSIPGKNGFSPAFSSGITFTNSNLTGTTTFGGPNSNARSVDFHPSGKYYIEFTFSTPASMFVGLMNAAFANTDQGGVGLNSAAWINFGGGAFQNTIQYNSASLGLITPNINPANGVGKLAVDLGLKKIWMANQGQVAWNNNNGDPASNINGYDITALVGTGNLYLLFGSSANGATWTVNTGASPFNDIVPTSFAAGW